MEIKHQKILISRTDSIGDVVLTIPMAGLIKEKYPESRIVFLGSSYTKDIVNCSKHIDSFLDWSEIKKLEFNKQKELLKKENIDICIHVFPNKNIARLAKKSNIKTRIGTSHRPYHFLYCNVLPSFSRRKSDLHEAQLNIKLLSSMGITNEESFSELHKYYGFSKLPVLNPQLEVLLSKDSKNIILHAKSKGSAREWGLENYRKLTELALEKGMRVFLTGTEDEGKLYREKLVFEHPNLYDLSGKMSLQDLIAFISKTDVLVAASTGPLHIAAATSTLAIGVFPPIKPMHPGRWSPIGNKVKVFVKDKPLCKDCLNGEKCECMMSISPEALFEEIEKDD